MAYEGPKVWTSTPTQITVAAGGLPSWVPGPGQYTTASLGAINTDVSPMYSASGKFGGTQGSNAMLVAWEGSAFVPTIGLYGSIYFWGGGHYSYYGDDLIRYDVETRHFSRVWGPSPYCETAANPPSVPNDDTHLRVTADGEFVTALAAGYAIPCPYHTYNGIIWVPQAAIPGSSALGSLVMFMNENTGVKIPIPLMWSFDLSAASNNWAAWTKRMHMSPPGFTNPYGLHSGAVYDPKRNVVWTNSGEEKVLWRNNFVTGVNEVCKGNFNTFPGSFVSEVCMTYLPAQDCLVSWAQGTSAPAYWAVDLSSVTTATTTMTGCRRYQLLIANPSSGPFYSAGNLTGGGQFNMEVVNGAIVFTNVSATSIGVYTLTPPAAPADWRTTPWTWDGYTPTKKDAVNDNTQYKVGTEAALYSKARYVPAIKSILYVYNVSKKMNAYRHPSWT